MISRRNFLRQTGVMTAAALAVPSALCSRPLPANGAGIPPDGVGIQLYSLRNEIGADVKGVIEKVAEAGYNNVEVYGYSIKNGFWGLDVKAFAALLKSHHLSSSSGHYGIDQFLGPEGKEDDLKAYIEAGNILGHDYITVPSINEQFRKTADDYKKVAERFNRAGELCKKAGLKLAYHNHAFEFEQAGQETGYDILLKDSDPSLVDFELDIYWAVRGKVDPVSLFGRHRGRFVMWHVKDMDRSDPGKNTEIGKGSIDYKKIFEAAGESGMKVIFVEQENFEIDPFQSIRESCTYIKNNLI